MDCTHTGCDCQGKEAGRPPLEPAEIARLEERRQALGLATLADEHEFLAGGTMGFSGEGSWTNFACGLGLEGPVADTDLDRLVTFYESRGVPPRIEVCPFADTSLVNGLCERGFVAEDYEKVLARGLELDEDMAATLTRLRAEGLELELVDRQDAAQVETFVEVSSSGFRPPDEPIPEAMDRVARRSVADPDVDSVLARLDGSVAAGATVTYRTEIACLAGASVLPASRRLGLQRALIIKRLELARERGCTLATIHAKPDSPTERNASLLDFHAVYTKVLMEKPVSAPSPATEVPTPADQA